LTQQAIQLGFMPRLSIQHTSEKAAGQIYIPAINWGLAIMVLLLVLFFGWFATVINENQAGLFNAQVDKSFRMGMMWFIISEVMFFAAFFGALFYARELSVPWIGGEGVKVFNKLLLWQDFAPTWPTNGPDRLGGHADGSFETIAAFSLPAINTAPSYSPDGSRVAFESDQGGTQQIYVMNADGSGQARISFGNGRYSTPVWSPDGQWIAFTKQGGGKFAIGVMKPDGSGERILTEGYHNEGPTWAPNSRVVMFFRDTPGAGGGPQLWSVDITGYNERQVPTPSFASDPAWSPLIN
jgi:hypothetical protein